MSSRSLSPESSLSSPAGPTLASNQQLCAVLSRAPPTLDLALCTAMRCWDICHNLPCLEEGTINEGTFGGRLSYSANSAAAVGRVTRKCLTSTRRWTPWICCWTKTSTRWTGSWEERSPRLHDPPRQSALPLLASTRAALLVCRCAVLLGLLGPHLSPPPVCKHLDNPLEVPRYVRNTSYHVRRST